MKYFILAALAAFTLSAQTAKVDAAAVPATPPPTERQLTETEVLKFDLAVSRLRLLRKDYKIDEYEQKSQPIQTEQNAVAITACKSVGLTDEQIQKGLCGFVTGHDPDGKQLNDETGKPLQPRVWVVLPKPTPPVTADKK